MGNIIGNVSGDEGMEEIVALIREIVNNKRFSEIQPNIQDNHISRRKLTDEEIRQIRKWKAEGKLNREIRELLNNKVSMTTISDILTGKRYSEIK